MSDANRLRLSTVRETTLGVTPNTPRMRGLRFKSEALVFTPTYLDSDEMRSDRMLGDPIKTMQAASGPISTELYYPDDNGPLSDILRSAFFNTWVNTPTFFNDGTADSVITDAGTTANTYVVASGGAAVVAGHLVRATGFTNPANNQVFPATASTGTTIVGAALGLTAEAAPPGNAKLKVVGFAGAAGDITATADGLGSTLLDFTTLGLAVGQWIKVGGTAAGDKFATAGNNDFVRITAIAAHALTCDNLPAAWGIDAGTGKTIKVWFGDQIKNGTAFTSLSMEKGFMDQSVPTYISVAGMVVNQAAFKFESQQKITADFTFMGMGGGQDTTSLDAAPDANPTAQILAANAYVGRLGEAGAQITGPNFPKSLTLNIANNLRMRDAVDQQSPIGIGVGECAVTGSVDTYFGDNTLLAKFYNGTATSLNLRTQRNGQALLFQIPRATYRGGGNPVATGKNTDIMASFDYQASVDTLTQAHVILDRMEYYEA